VYVTNSEYFELNDEGISCVKKQAKYDGSMVDDAISSCPVNAISWQACTPEGDYTDGVVEHQDVAN